MTKRLVLNVAVLCSLLLPPVLVGCDDTVYHEKTVKQKSDGTTVTKEEKKTESSDGSSKTTTEKKVEKTEN